MYVPTPIGEKGQVVVDKWEMRKLQGQHFAVGSSGGRHADTVPVRQWFLWTIVPTSPQRDGWPQHSGSLCSHETRKRLQHQQRSHSPHHCSYTCVNRRGRRWGAKFGCKSLAKGDTRTTLSPVTAPRCNSGKGHTTSPCDPVGSWQPMMLEDTQVSMTRPRDPSDLRLEYMYKYSYLYEYTSECKR